MIIRVCVSLQVPLHGGEHGEHGAVAAGGEPQRQGRAGRGRGQRRALPHLHRHQHRPGLQGHRHPQHSGKNIFFIYYCNIADTVCQDVHGTELHVHSSCVYYLTREGPPDGASPSYKADM